MSWYYEVTNDLSKVADAVDFYRKELEDATKEVKLKGNLETNSTALPGTMEYRFNQLQEIEAILEHLNIQLRKTKSKLFRQYLENYNRVMSTREAEKYIEGEKEYVDMEELVNEFALVRNQYQGIIKSLEIKGFQINHVVKLRTSGLEDATI